MDAGFTFDQDLNMVCGFCGHVVFPASKKAEPPSPPATHKSASSHGHPNWKGGAGYAHGYVDGD